MYIMNHIKINLNVEIDLTTNHIHENKKHNRKDLVTQKPLKDKTRVGMTTTNLHYYSNKVLLLELQIFDQF